uniref:Replication stress response regulator SDE2 n=1 Tax=Leptobrachium leishanense TaxID=445787 RepID=A0A8C5PP68_9ANUR
MAASVWVRDAITGRVCAAQGATARHLLPLFQPELITDFYVKCNGRLVDLDEELQDGLTYSVEPRLCGGKGGFGSMLRALGAQIEKTTNREACRDLSGRRLRDVNHEKAMAEWIKKQAEREAEKEQRRLERLQRKLAEPKHYFTDPEYHKQCHDMSERLEDSVIKGLQASSSTVVAPEAGECRKRKMEAEGSKSKSGKKKCFWTGVEGLEVSSSSDSDSDCESPSTSASSQNTDPKPPSSESSSDSEGSEMELAPMPTPDVLEEQDDDLQVPMPTSELREEQQGDSEALMQTSEVLEEQKSDLETPEEQTRPETSKEQETSNLQPLVPPSEATLPAHEATTGATCMDSSPLDLLACSSEAELEALGLEKLKLELMALGLKCGGTLQERAARLYTVRGLSRDQIDPSLFAKPAKGKRK